MNIQFPKWLQVFFQRRAPNVSQEHADTHALQGATASSTFIPETLTPAQRQRSSSEDRLRRSAARIANGGNPLSVLIIEDEPHYMAQYVSALRGSGYRVTEADTIVAALATIHEEHSTLDLVLCDTQLATPQGRNTEAGFFIFNAAIQSSLGIPFIGMSALSENLVPWMERGAVGFFDKHGELALTQRIDAMMKRRGA